MGFDRILIVKPSAFGDVVHSLPFLVALRRSYPKARVGWVISRACAGLLEGRPDVDDLYVFERKRWGGFRNLMRNLREMRAFSRTLRAQKFDLVVDLQGLFRSALLTRMTGAPRRVGFANARELGWVFYTDRVRVPSPDMHAVDRYLLVAEHLGLAIERPVRFNVCVTEDARARASAMLGAVNPGGRPVAALIPGSQWPSKRWPAELFADLAGRLGERGFCAVFLGAPDDVPLVERIRAMMANPAASLAGKTTIPQLSAVLGRAGVVVANDSGPMHLAMALGRPVVALYGPTSPDRTGPYGGRATVLKSTRPCAPCYDAECEDVECLREIGVERVLAAILDYGPKAEKPAL